MNEKWDKIEGIVKIAQMLNSGGPVDATTYEKLAKIEADSMGIMEDLEVNLFEQLAIKLPAPRVQITEEIIPISIEILSGEYSFLDHMAKDIPAIIHAFAAVHTLAHLGKNGLGKLAFERIKAAFDAIEIAVLLHLDLMKSAKKEARRKKKSAEGSRARMKLRREKLTEWFNEKPVRLQYSGKRIKTKFEKDNPDFDKFDRRTYQRDRDWYLKLKK